MINHFNRCLQMLLKEVIGKDFVSFQPPDDDWRKSLSENALNIYLVDVRENRDLRSNEFVRLPPQNGWVKEIAAPRRIDCHYLITAWSPASVTADVEPTIDEHALLYKVIRVLMQHEPITLQEIVENIADATEKDSWTTALQESYGDDLNEIQLPMQVLPSDGFPQYGEFWGAMGQNSRWKPAIYLIVTLPVLAPEIKPKEQVTSRMLSYHFLDAKRSDDGLFEIAGRLVAGESDDLSPVGGVEVLLAQKGGGQRTERTNADGRFVFRETLAGTYTLSKTSDDAVLLRDLVLPSVEQYDLLIVTNR